MTFFYVLVAAREMFLMCRSLFDGWLEMLFINYLEERKLYNMQCRIKNNVFVNNNDIKISCADIFIYK